jgi:hypothetical protein
MPLTPLDPRILAAAGGNAEIARAVLHAAGEVLMEQTLVPSLMAGKHYSAMWLRGMGA